MRLKDWAPRMYATIDQWRDGRFEWGTSDCCAFAGAVVYAMTGVDHFQGWFGTYDSEAGARDALKARGYETLLEALTDVFGNPRPVGVARRGDLVIADDLGGGLEQIGVCLGAKSVSWAPGEGLIEVRTLDLGACFRV